MIKRTLALALTLFCTASAAGTVTVTDGGSNTSDTAISTEVLNSCTLTTTDAVFTNYTATQSTDLTTSTAGVSIQCNDGAQYTLELISNPGPTTTEPAMVHATLPNEYLVYLLDSISDGITLDGLRTYTADGEPVTFTLSYLIPAGQFSAAAGDYSDTQTLTIDLLN
ncbi:spore coat protein U domain-containing protein [Deinococcus roseus]|uniref:Spore coat protein U/FanG domain-containing protein n=1 Tax=Deinococcus roseus TaxID=392414 RepID=A0ABQ2DD75_9DEIO|nr:spore coat protein U domain-containing protein [Deinococcus roseus]GGJ53756.1 hypothetical protein GCM10008938_44730 [Deinococcus roseus]